MTTKAKKRRLAEDESTDGAPRAKKQKIDEEENQDESGKRLNKFKSDLINQLKPYFEISSIINNILSYSNHLQIHKLWCNIHTKLGKYSFLMRKGCQTSEITKFEQDKNVSIPSDLRVSLMICDAVMFPSIFKNDIESPTNVHTKAPQPLNFAPEICIAPLKEWFPFFKDEVRFKSYFEEYMDKENMGSR